MIKTYKGTKFLLRPNCVTSSRFVYEGRPDEYYVRILAAFADKATCFVDVGGNVGLYTILLCNDFAKGWLFEPNPVAARMARHNIAINDAGDRFLVLEAAAGSENSIAKFAILDTPLATAHVDGEQKGMTMDVGVLRLDHFLPGDQSLVVKVDAEGSDAEVLVGLYGFLCSGSMKICLFECQNDDILQRTRSLVSEVDYTILDRKRKLNAHGGDPAKINRDLFLVRNDLVEYYLQLTASP